MSRRVQYFAPPRPRSGSTLEDQGSPPPPLPQLGTILYRGSVPPTKGEWLGIEWDDPSRGKHSGTYDKTGVRYFETRVEGAGSFLRPNAPGLIVEGKSFRQAFEAKYLGGASVIDQELETNDPTTSTSQFYKTSSNFEVEVVLSDKVAARFRHLSRLREAGLEWEALSRAFDVAGEAGVAAIREFGAKLSGLETLNLSCTMLSSLEEVQLIADSLPKLKVMSLNSNRFDPIRSSIVLPGFEKLSILKLNNTLLSWTELVHVSPSLPNLVELEFGFNRLANLVAETRQPIQLPKLEILNLESNHLSDWKDVVRAACDLPHLKTLVLASNRFKELVLPSTSSSPAVLRQLRHLSLSSNLLSSWSKTIDDLGASTPSSFPALSSLDLADNPLEPPLSTPNTSTISESTSREARQVETRLLVIARLGFLDMLDKTPITAVEREDAERFWIKQVSTGKGEAREEMTGWARARLDYLETKHSIIHSKVGTGLPRSTESPSDAPAALKSRLIRLRVVDASSAAPLNLESAPAFDRSLELSVLPTLRTLLLRSQLARLLGKPLAKTKFRLVGWLESKDSPRGEEKGERWMRVEIPTKEEGRELGWWGFEEGDAVGIEEIQKS